MGLWLFTMIKDHFHCLGQDMSSQPGGKFLLWCFVVAYERSPWWNLPDCLEKLYALPNPPALHHYIVKILLEFATMISHYVLDVEFYDQIDCVARGSPLGPVMAIIFMCHFEVKWITQNNARHTIWFRHVDDISTLFKTKDSTIQLLQFLNDCHNNIKFIIKIEENDQIRFLHILLKRTSQHHFSTSFYRMNTFTGPYTK